jgi:hypothetical protein
LADKPFAIIGVNSDDDLDEIRDIVKKKNLTWRSFQNQQSDGAIADKWGIRGWPTIFILDENGKIRHRDIRGDRIDTAIEELLEEMGHTVKITHEDEEEEAENDEDSAEEKAEDTEDSEDKD